MQKFLTWGKNTFFCKIKSLYTINNLCVVIEINASYFPMVLGILIKASRKKYFSATHRNPPLRNNVDWWEALIKLPKEFCIGFCRPIALPWTTMTMFHNGVTSKTLEGGSKLENQKIYTSNFKLILLFHFI